MSGLNQKRKIPIKTSYQYLVRAKLYGIVTLNSLEGMMKELDNLIPVDMERGNIDTFSEELRRFQNNQIMPTSHGDYLDRALKSLSKELNIQVPIDLENSTAVKNVVMTIILQSQGDNRRQFTEMLEQPNEMISKSSKFDYLVEMTCYYLYKKPVCNVSEDTVSFIRRSIHEMLRSKQIKDQLRSRLTAPGTLYSHPMEPIPNTYEYVDNTLYIQSQGADDGRYMRQVDMMPPMRPTTEKDIEMMHQAGLSTKNGDSISM